MQGTTIVMPGSSAGAIRRVISGLIVLAMLLLSASPSDAGPAGHARDDGTTAMALTLSARYCTDMGSAAPDMANHTCCVGYTCAAPGVVIMVPIVVRTVWPVRYWTADNDATGIRPEPFLGPPIARG